MNQSIFFFISSCFALIHGFQLIDYPENDIWGKEGEPLELDCKVDEPWMWCYWEVTRSSSNESVKYPVTFGSQSEGNEDIKDGIKLKLSEYSCGIEIDELQHSLHDGTWKCHIANTNQKPSSVQEIEMFTSVARKADLDFTWKLQSEGSKWPMNQMLHEIVQLKCSANMEVLPIPRFAIGITHPDGTNEILVESDPLAVELEYEHELDLEDDNSNFYCKMTQENDQGIHFEEQIQSDPMNLAYAPILDIGDENLEYVFHNESIVLPVVFLAKPKPDPQDIQWEIKYGHFLQLANPDENGDNFTTSSLEFGQKEHQYSVNLEILNISSDAQVTIKIWNEIGDLTHTMQIKYDPPLPQIEIDNEAMAFPYWITVIIALVVLLIILCIIFVSCKRKEKNSKEKLEAQNRAVIGHYANNLAQEHNQKNKKKGQMVTNLDDFPDPEQTSPMLDGQDSNNSDRDEVDDTLTVEMDSMVESLEGEIPPPTLNKNEPNTFTNTQYQYRSTFESRTVNTTRTTNLSPNVIPSSFKPQEPHLSLRRENKPPVLTLVPGGSSLPGYGQRGGSGQFRLGGITQYPVQSPTPPGYSPYLPPGRKTSFIDYSNPKNL